LLQPGIPLNEKARLSALRALLVLDTPSEIRFDRITGLAQRLLNMPIVLISLIDENRQWFKSRQGLEVQETARDISFCAHAILEEKALIVEDTLADPRFADNPLVTGEPHIRFYAGHVLKTPDGSPVGTLCLIDRKARVFPEHEQALLKELAGFAERELQAMSSEFYQEIARSMQVGLYVYRLEDPDDDRSLRMIATNEAATTFTGIPQDAVLGRTLDESFPGLRETGIPQCYAEVIRTGVPQTWEDILYADDRIISTAFYVKAFPLAGQCVAILFENISERKRAEQTLERLALTDALTELPNRRMLQNRLTQEIALAARHKRALAVMFLDMNGFKAVNDTFGHEVGDLALKAFAQRVTAIIRSTDMVARIGGDEFVVLMPEVAQVADATVVASKILNALTVPFDLDGRIVQLGASIGISGYPNADAEADANTLLKQADAAMFQAKQKKSGFQFFENLSVPQ
jgi:diguanylate cyclase (GGDEF)-like protein